MRLPGRARRRRWWLLAVPVVLAVGGVVAYDTVLNPPRDLTVTVDGRPVPVRTRRPTVDAALAAAHVRPHDGTLLAAVSHRPIQPDGDRAQLFVDGALASGRRRVRDHDRIVAVDGADRVEDLVSHDVTGPYIGLPDVEADLWRPGVREVDRVEAGGVSGEEFDRIRLVAAVPASRETERVVALTFDDGPNPQWTPAIINVLNAKAVRATFCTVGYATQRFPDLLKLEVANNEVACDHTLDHIIPLSKRAQSQIADQIWKQADQIQTLTGVDPQLFRSPGGDDASEVITQAHRRRLRVMKWSDDPHDYERPGVEAIVARVLRQAHPGCIVLLHDGGGDRSETLAALPMIIDGLRAQGYLFTTPLDEPAA